MKASKVYFTTFKTSYSENIPAKLKRLILAAGIKDIDFEDKYAAVKIHFGELGDQGTRRKTILDRLQYALCGKQEKCP